MKSLTTYSLRPERVASILLVIMAILIVVHVIAMQVNFNPALGLKEKYGFHYWQIAFFDLDEEESFGTWFSAGLLMIAAGLLVQQARVLRAQGKAWHKSWFVLGIGFCILSMDEIVGMHELVNSMLDEIPWTVIGFPIFAIVGLQNRLVPNCERGRFGSQAALRFYSSPTAALGRIAVVRQDVFVDSIANVRFHQKRTFRSVIPA